MDRVRINNQVVLMRKFVKKAKIHFMNKFIKDIRLLEKKISNQRCTEMLLLKMKRKKERIMNEVKILKQIKPDFISRMVLSKAKDWEAIIKSKNPCLEDRCYALLATYEPVQKECTQFYNDNSDFADRIASLINEWEANTKHARSYSKLKNKKRLKSKTKIKSIIDHRNENACESSVLNSENEGDTSEDTNKESVQKNKTESDDELSDKSYENFKTENILKHETKKENPSRKSNLREKKNGVGKRMLSDSHSFKMKKQSKVQDKTFSNVKESTLFHLQKNDMSLSSDFKKIDESNSPTSNYTENLDGFDKSNDSRNESNCETSEDEICMPNDLAKQENQCKSQSFTKFKKANRTPNKAKRDSHSFNLDDNASEESQVGSTKKSALKIPSVQYNITEKEVTKRPPIVEFHNSSESEEDEKICGIKSNAGTVNSRNYNNLKSPAPKLFKNSLTPVNKKMSDLPRVSNSQLPKPKETRQESKQFPGKVSQTPSLPTDIRSRFEAIAEVYKPIEKSSVVKDKEKAIKVFNLDELEDVDEIPIHDSDVSDGSEEDTCQRRKDSFFIRDGEEPSSDDGDEEDMNDQSQLPPFKQRTFSDRSKGNRGNNAVEKPNSNKDMPPKLRRKELRANRFSESSEKRFNEKARFAKDFQSGKRGSDFKSERNKNFGGSHRENFRNAKGSRSSHFAQKDKRSKLNIQESSNQKRLQFGKNRNPVNQDDEKPLHPSWEAKKKMKETANTKFQGKRIVFDD